MEFGKSFNFPSEDHDAVFVSFTGAKLADKFETVNTADNLFNGEIAAWAQRRTRLLGEFIEPRQMYIEWVDSKPHRVAWVDHLGVNRETKSSYHIHHLVCDCAFYEDVGPQLNIDDSFGSCPILENAVYERTEFVARQHHIREAIAAYDGISVEDYERNEELNDLIIGAMENLLLFDQKHPEEWAGNIVSGEHEVRLMSIILAQPEETVRMCAEILQMQDKVRIDGNTVRLAA